MDDVTRRERTISGALALAMHALFLILLVVGVSWQSQRTAAPVTVELWSELPPAARPAPEPPPPPEPVKQAPRPEPRPEPKPEFKPAPKPDIALQEQLAKKKLLEAKERERELKEKLAKEKAEKAEKDRQLKEAEAQKRKDKELADQKQRELEKKRLAEKHRQEELARIAKEKEQALAKLLAQQQAQQAAEAAARARLDAYSRLVGDRIKRYIVLPPNIQGNPEAQFEVVQIPGGEILTVRLKRSSGNPAYDAAVERAIHKASPLPPPPDPARFGEVRELDLKFRPKE
ncbi:MAG: cell envelope integrity protein TolA [Betaproteobacteria bacterium]